MSCDQDEFAAILKSEPFRLNRRYMERTLAPVIRLEVTGSRTLDHFMVVEFLRQTHALRTAEWIRKHYPKERSDSYVAGVYLWEAVALIAQAHGVDLESLDPARYRSDTLSGQGVQINLPYLSCLLRLADLCHFARDRALPYVREAKQFCSILSREIWQKYGDIADTQPISESGMILINAQCSDATTHSAILRSARVIEQELLRQHRYLHQVHSPYRMAWKGVDTTSIRPASGAPYRRAGKRFQLNCSRIVDSRAAADAGDEKPADTARRSGAMHIHIVDGSSRTPAIPVVPVSRDVRGRRLHEAGQSEKRVHHGFHHAPPGVWSPASRGRDVGSKVSRVANEIDWFLLTDGRQDGSQGLEVAMAVSDEHETQSAFAPFPDG
jgi:hypothetical protein